jgi:hypothetical protein
MNSNSILKYDLVKDLIYFSKTQTPGLADFIKDYTSSSPETVESLIKDSQIEGITQIPVSASNAIKSFLATVEGLNLATSKNITLNLEILEGIDIGNVDIVSKNFDKSKTYFSKNGTILKDFLLDFKPLSKYKTMANCKPCLKSTWQTDNSFGFTGNVGGSWNGTSWKNGQKLYNITIPKYSLTEPVVNQPYVIWWKPTFSYTFTDFSGIPQIITNKSKWVATLVSDNYSLTTASFFSIVNLFTSNTNPPYIAGGKCPDEKPIPQNFWYNFQGPKGNFRLDSSLQQQLTLYDIQGNVTFKKVCKTYTPSPIVSPPIRWACKATVGCVMATNGPFSTYGECAASCSVDYGWNCFSGSCTPGTQANPGLYSSLSQCSTYCISTYSGCNFGWICSGSICVPGTVNNTGSFTTEAECIGLCSPYYTCTSTGCITVPNGTLGAYSSLAACQSSCSVGYNCVNGLCVTSSFGTTGSYATLTACQLSCSVNYGFNCTANGCVPGSAGNPGIFNTLQDCQSKCTASYGYTCTPNGCITGSLASPGAFNTLQECQITCTASYGFTCTPNGCVTGSIASPGIYSSVAACIAACTGSYGWNCTSTGCVPGSPANTGSYLTQQACEAACPSGWNCTGGTIDVLLFSGSIVNGITSSYNPNGTHLFLTESIDTLNIYDNSTGEFEYGETPKFISYTASFTGKTVSSSTGSLHFYFNGAQDPPNNYSQIPILNFPSYTSASITRIISGTTTLNPYGYGDLFTTISLISSSHPSIILNDVQLEFNGTLPHPRAFSCYPVFFPNTGSYLTAIECRSSCSVNYGFNDTINGCVPGTAGNPGKYPTLLDCQTKSFIDWGWVCISGSCVTGSSYNIGLGPQYVNQIDCILNCSNTASYGWNCCSGSCIPGTINNTGSYATLPLCQSSCSRQYGWICTSEGCVTGSAGNTGSFSTLSACEDYCFYGWDCVSGNCITSSFGTTGSFPNETLCLLNCNIPYWNCDPIDGCYQVPFGTNTGSFTSFDSCSAACIPTPTSSITGYDCVSGNCVTASVGTGSYATLESCSIYCTQSYGWNCDPTSFYCSPGTINNTGSYTTYESCSAVCAPIPPQSTFCPCNPLYSTYIFSSFISGWIYNDPIINEYGITNWGFGNNSANIIILPSASSGVYLTRPNIFQISCSYNVCFDITLNSLTGNTIAIINSASNAPSPINLIPGTTQAISTVLNNITTQELTLSFITDDSSNQSITVSKVCVTLISCPPPPEPLLDCFISGSGYSFSTGSIDCLCPEGYVTGSGGCISSSSLLFPKNITGQLFNTTPSQSLAWGWNYAVLYDQYNTAGISDSSLSPFDPSPLFGDPTVINTQFAFNILKAPFWRTTGWTENGMVPSFNLANNHMIGLPLSNTWLGGGSFLTTPTTKTMYAALIADDVFRLKLNGSILLEINTSPQLSDFNLQQINARTAGINPYITTNLSPSPASNAPYNSWHIFPITVPEGCNTITLEARDTDQVISGFAGFIFDNTSQEIAHATNLNDLNIFWSSRSNLNNTPQAIYNFDSVPITASCPPGSTPTGPLPCDLCLTTGSIIPCGDCVTCNHGVLYNGNVVDKGGYQLQGRGPGGIVNTGSILNTWVIPTELDWNFLSTTLDNNFLPPSSNYEGALNTNSGGKLKDYSRDNNASCWGFPNAGAQTLTNASGWAGVAGGKRDNEGVFSDLGFNGEWWSANSLSTPPITNATLLATRELKHYSTDVYRNIRSKNYGFSIRLVRPALATETNGQLILDAYQGNDGTYYDGIVIGNRVWITKNLSETLYNNGSLINLEINPNTWSNSPSSNNPSPSNPYSCFYANDSLNSSKVIGNLNPATGECYPKPLYYVYRNCSSGLYLIQSQIGNTTTPEKVQKDSSENCWKFIEISEGLPSYPSSAIFGSFSTNYFASSPTVYNNCEECNAIHTLYLSFNTKPC